MDKKMYLFLALGIGIFGILVAVVGRSVMIFFNMIPEDAVDNSAVLLNQCNSKISVYLSSKSELDKKNFCCMSMDLNNDGTITNEEYCFSVYNKDIEGKSVAMFCNQPITYYSNPSLCEI